ncbi:MAG: alpha/beta fold hydrolase [Cytophagaceae bacterium]|nr:alpha/beta fold hydrolase [Cytophagaceae bacterium]
MQYKIKSDGEFRYIEEGDGQTLVLLHGLFGSLSNWDAVVESFSKKFRVIIPLLPIYEMPIKSAGLDGLVAFVSAFVNHKKLDQFSLIGNSLGGHVGLIYCLRNQDKVKSLTLTASSGLFENSMGASYPRRGSYQFVQERVRHTFYNPDRASKEMIDEIFDVTNSIPKCMRIIAIAKSAQRHNMAKELGNIKVPTLLIWGLNDAITPPMVAHEFNRLIPKSELHFIDQCGHAPMMEHPAKFNKIYEKFIHQIS